MEAPTKKVTVNPGGTHGPATVVVGTVTIFITLKRWELKSNRHNNTDGTRWGWIEGTEIPNMQGHITWSNSPRYTGLTEQDAAAVVTVQHAWLESQRSPDSRRQEAILNALRLDDAIERVEKNLAQLQAERQKHVDVIDALGPREPAPEVPDGRP